MKKAKLILMFFTFLIACISDSKKRDIYSEFGKRGFEEYRGLSLYIREYDHSRNPIIYLQNFSNGYNICGYKYFTTKGATSSIIASGSRKFSDTCQVVISSADSLLVKDFASMKIRRLMVDRSGNVFISINSLEAFDIAKLVKYNDSTQKYKSWISLGGNWYQRP